MTKVSSPQRRYDHESALIDGQLHIFGGLNEKDNYLPRYEIWTKDVREKKKWIRRLTDKKTAPPPCHGAQCVVNKGLIFSYGGWKKGRRGGDYLEEVFCLDPKKMRWIEVATPSKGKPWRRGNCCLLAIAGRIIMFGGGSDSIPSDRLQSGAQNSLGVNNEIYEIVVDEGGEKGDWLDVQLSGKRPQPRQNAATEVVSEDRALLCGGSGGGKYFDDAYVIDLREKKWICIDIISRPTGRHFHRMCRINKKGFEEKNCVLLLGGFRTGGFSDHAYILDFDQRKFHSFVLSSEIAPLHRQTLHCVANQDGSAQIIVTGGLNWAGSLKDILNEFTLGPSNQSYVQVETEIFSSVKEVLAEPKKEPRKSLEVNIKVEMLGTEESRRGVLTASTFYHPNIIQDAIGQPAAKKFREDIDREVTEEELKKLAPFLFTYWKVLSRHLPGKKDIVELLEKKHVNEPGECPLAMLMDWFNRNGSDATVKIICKALIEVGHKRSAEIVFGVNAVRQVPDL